MANITFAVDDQALALAKAYAAEHGTTLNKLVGAFLASVGNARPRAALTRSQQTCMDYSLGKITLTEATETLGLQDAGLFLALMRQSGLPLPRLTDDALVAQADGARDAVRAAFGIEQRPGQRRARKPATE